jgi:flagellar M-ring protein FliF
MPEVLSRLQQRAVTFWKELDKSQKIRIYIIAGIILAAVIAGFIVLSKVTYEPLFIQGIKSQNELTEIKSTLTAANIKFKDVNGNLSVNSKQINQAQQVLIDKGLPKNADTIFNDAYITNVKLSSTESDKRKLDKNSQERTMAAKLMMMDNVENASVTLVIPEPQTFAFDQNIIKPTASIMITPTEPLTKNQVHGIIMWVSKSVENLDPKDITVIDNNMKEYTSQSDDPLIDKASSQYEQKLLWQTNLENNVKKMFSGQFDSFDNYAVVANPVLDFDTLKTTSKTIDDNKKGPALVSGQTVKEDLTNGTAASGTPGVNSNPGTSYQISTGGDGGTYKKSSVTVNNAFDETNSEMEKATGQMVPEKSSLAINLLYGGRVTDDKKITAEIQSVKEIANAATGIPIENITVNKFKIAPAVVVPTSMADTIKNLLSTYGSFALIIFLAIIFMLAALPKKKREVDEDLEAAAALATGSSGPRFIVPESGEDIPEIALEERSEVKKQIDKFVKQKPDAVAQLLRNWLSDEWDG